MNSKQNTLHQFAKKLYETFPPKKPVRLNICITPYSRDEYGKISKPKARVYGCTEDRKKYFKIRINKCYKLEIQIDTLMHEWAHCLANWHALEDPHSKEWGIWYAKIYREVMKW